VKQIRVILADDNPEVLNIVSQLLNDEFTVVGTYNDGRSVVEKGRLLEPEIIVLDISLGDISGFEVARMLRQGGSSARLVFLTVHEEEEFIQAGLDAGACAYITKRRLHSDLPSALRAATTDEVFVSNML
jgi:DNA-binding NarL/FixJ family response regulator